MLGRTAILLALAVSSNSAIVASARGQTSDTADAAPSDDTAATGDEQRARDAFRLGSRAFDDRRWEDAVRYFERAYELSRRAALLYNIGATLERMGSRAPAIDAFERYLSELPDAENRAEVEERIRTLRAGLPESAPPTSGPGAAPWIVVAAGAVAAGAGAGLLVLANDAKGRVEAAPAGTFWDEVDGDAADAGTFSVAGAVLVAVGGAALAGGLIWALLAGGDAESEGVAIGPGGVSVRGRF